VSPSSIRKAAVLLSSLPRGHADALLGRLDRHQAKAVLAEINKGEAVTPDEREAILLEFSAAGSANQRVHSDGGVARPSSSHAGLLAFLTDVHPQILATILADERPQTIALVTAHVPAAYGAQLISYLPAEQQLAVIRAVAAMEPTDPQVVLEVAHVLKRRLPLMAA
jgi:flagellar motor switch protein FliG